MKIAVTGTRGFPGVQGGVESHCEKLYRHIVKHGCEIVVYAREPYVGSQVRTYDDIKIVPLSCSKNKFLEAISHTFKSVLNAKRLNPDILHIHAVGPSLFVPMARALGMRVVVTNHGPDYMRQKWPLPAKIFMKFCERMGMVYANEVITIAKNIADDIKAKYNRDSTVIPNGVDLPQPAVTREYLDKYGVEARKYVLAVGRFVPEKGFDDLIDAFAQIDENGWKLVIAGDADHEDKYSRTLKSKAIKDKRIVLTGFIKGQSLHELYTHAGLFVLPSYYEGLPIVLLEALSYGLSCIASDIPANRNVKLSEERFFKPGAVALLSAKIQEFIHIPFEEKERTEQINMIKSKYSWELIAEDTFKTFKKAIR